MLSFLIDGQEPRNPLGVGQFAPSNMVAINPIVHDMRADAEVGRHFGDRAFFWALERRDRDRMRKTDPANCRDRYAVAFSCFHAGLIQVGNDLFISRM